MKRFETESKFNRRQETARFAVQTNAFVRSTRRVVAVVIRFLLRTYCRFEILGRENLRTNRSLVLVANHCSHLDSVCLLAALPLGQLDRAFPAAAADYFFQPGFRRWFAAVCMNAVPFVREGRARHSLAVCQQVLAEAGNILIMFPEGTRSANGQLQSFKSGIGALVAARDVDVVPCYLDGTARAWPKGKRLPRPRKVRLVIGRPRNYTRPRREGSAGPGGERPHPIASSSRFRAQHALVISTELHGAVAALAQEYARR